MENNFDKIKDGLFELANSITPASSFGGRDANDGHIPQDGITALQQRAQKVPFCNHRVAFSDRVKKLERLRFSRLLAGSDHFWFLKFESIIQSSLDLRRSAALLS